MSVPPTRFLSVTAVDLSLTGTPQSAMDDGKKIMVIDENGNVVGINVNEWVSFISPLINGTPPPQVSAPVNVSPPVIIGTPQVGVPLQMTAGIWMGNPTPTITRQWLINDVVIPSANGSFVYTPTIADVGKQPTAREIATNTQGTVAATSLPAGLVTAALVADVTIKVYASMVTGAVIAVASPGTTLSGTHPGVSITSAGNVYVSDRDAMIDALPFVVQTSGLDYGLVLDTADYYDFTQHSENIVAWFDGQDNRNLQIDTQSNVVVEWQCKADSTRKARNDVYPAARPSRALPSALGNVPGISFDATANSVYGLFFQDAPIYAGIQRLQFDSTVRMSTRWDNKYDANILNQVKKVWPGIDMAANLTVAKPVVMTIIADKNSGTVTIRVNGLQIDTPEVLPAGYTFDYDAIAFVVFYADNAGFTNSSIVFGDAALGQHFIWKTAVFRGDLFSIISMIEAKPAT
jgi:hypothetical protein